MALVFDPNDPTNLGMFSKAGRYTNEKHIIFHKKEEILNNQRKFLKVTSLPHLKMEFEVKDPNKLLHEEEDEGRPHTAYSTKSKPEFEPFSKQMSRDRFYDSKKVRHPPPPCGFYNPKFKYTEKQPSTLFKYGKEKARPKFMKTETNFNIEEASQPIPDKIPKRVGGPIPMHLQSNRTTIMSPKDNPHESRFFFFEIPSASTKSKRPTTVDLTKSLGRDHKPMYKEAPYSPDYTPNFEYGRKGLGSCGPKFNKVSARKAVEYKSPSINQSFFDTSKSETFKYRRPNTASFNYYSPRDTDPTSPLPSFMQKSVSSRMAVGSFGQKALETNNYFDAKFQTVYSAFSPTKSKIGF